MSTLPTIPRQPINPTRNMKVISLCYAATLNLALSGKDEPRRVRILYTARGLAALGNNIPPPYPGVLHKNIILKGLYNGIVRKRINLWDLAFGAPVSHPTAPDRRAVCGADWHKLRELSGCMEEYRPNLHIHFTRRGQALNGPDNGADSVR
jgi:hypothetical protein